MTDAEEEIKIEGSQPVASATTYPEGGARAWLVVLGCFCVMFFTFGYLNAFG